MGEFPDEGDDTLIPLGWIEAALETVRSLPAVGFKQAAVDVARFGTCDTVIGVRTGPVVTTYKTLHGRDLMEVAGEIVSVAYQEHPEVIAIDAVGMGAGVVDRLNELRLDSLAPINVGLPARDSERFFNRRAELYWNLRERFRTGDIVIPNDDRAVRELASLRYRLTSLGKIRIESKEEMRARGQESPDRADMLALLFDGGGESLLAPIPYIGPSDAALLRMEMSNW
jgi:hypothetical protein